VWDRSACQSSIIGGLKHKSKSYHTRVFYESQAVFCRVSIVPINEKIGKDLPTTAVVTTRPKPRRILVVCPLVGKENCLSYPNRVSPEIAMPKSDRSRQLTAWTVGSDHRSPNRSVVRESRLRSMTRQIVGRSFSSPTQNRLAVMKSREGKCHFGEWPDPIDNASRGQPQSDSHDNPRYQHNQREPNQSARRLLPELQQD